MTFDHSERNRRYEQSPKVVQDQVDAMLGMGPAPRQSPDAGKPWRMDPLGRVTWDNVKPVSQSKAKAAQDAIDALNSQARGMGDA